ncbi:hypothetical protein ACLOJK_012903 [Asimina triloba]
MEAMFLEAWESFIQGFKIIEFGRKKLMTYIHEPVVRPLNTVRRASGGGGMYARTDASETSVLGVSAARHGRDPKRITDAGHQAGRSSRMRRRSGARLYERTGRGACGLESCRSCGAGRRVRNHCVASRWHVTGQILD